MKKDAKEGFIWLAQLGALAIIFVLITSVISSVYKNFFPDTIEVIHYVVKVDGEWQESERVVLGDVVMIETPRKNNPE